MKKNEPLLFIHSPSLVKRTLKVNKPQEEKKHLPYLKLLEDMQSLLEKSISSLCQVKTTNGNIEGNFTCFNESSLTIGNKLIPYEEIIEVNILKFEKKG